MPETPAACADTGWGILRVRGDDALAFLHGQLSSDVRALGRGEGQSWTYNSPKGRVLANGVLWRSPADAGEADVTMLLAGDLADAIARRLAMFVLRAKARVENATAALALIGLAGAGHADAARQAFGVTPALARAVPIHGGTVAFTLPDGRIVVVAPHDQGPILKAALARHANDADADAWRWHGIAAGVPWIGAATSDLFVPQALNLDALGAVSFRKGCYPGQEIVARMQYLGRLKERLFAFRVDALDVAAGMRLFSPTFSADQPAGTVVDAARDAVRGTALLAVAQIAAVEAGDLALGASGGAPLERRPLPYGVPGVDAMPPPPG